MSNSSECGQDQLAINTASTANDTKVICDEIVWKSNLDRKSHVPFFEQRDWDSVIAYWGSLLVNPLPPSISSPSEYTLTDLRTIHEIGKEEFSCSDPRYKRKTFAMRIGYNGCQYNGFQKQKGAIGVYTVEDDIQLALERSTVAAGRTDKDVSAVSQVISFSTYEDIDEDFLMEKFNSSSGARAGRLVAYDCARVPKRFHSLFSATWRRYIFYFPLNYGNYHGVDVDVEFVRLCLSKLVGKCLSYDGFAHRDVKCTDEVLSDKCTLFRTKVDLIDIPKVVKTMINFSGADDNSQIAKANFDDQSVPTISVELVGDRFLRRMVRILVATAVRESVLDNDLRDDDILLKIAASRFRKKASLSVPGCGLCLAGVGYDLQDLQVHRHNLAGTGGKKKRALLFPAEDDGNDEDFDGSNHSDNDCNQCEDVNL